MEINIITFIYWDLIQFLTLFFFFFGAYWNILRLIAATQGFWYLCNFNYICTILFMLTIRSYYRKRYKNIFSFLYMLAQTPKSLKKNLILWTRKRKTVISQIGKHENVHFVNWQIWNDQFVKRAFSIFKKLSFRDMDILNFQNELF